MSGRGVLRIREDGSLAFWCPGCKISHAVNGTWTFNGDYQRPTFAPSVLVSVGHLSPSWQGPKCWCTYAAEHPNERSGYRCMRCHSFVRDGRIEFLSDCSHELAGQTVQLQPF